jgi:hypothetical protein
LYKFLGKGTGELVGMYLRGRVRKRRSVGEKPTVQKVAPLDKPVFFLYNNLIASQYNDVVQT